MASLNSENVEYNRMYVAAAQGRNYETEQVGMLFSSKLKRHYLG